MAIREFADSGEILDYALEALTWTVNVGLLKGNDSGKLLPKDFATRAEIATILERFLKSVK